MKIGIVCRKNEEKEGKKVIEIKEREYGREG